MDSTSLYYFRELSKDLNMHRTAERIFVSQQTISNHILKLEEELGCRLYERKPGLTLTDAGREVLGFVDEMTLQQDNLKNTLADINNEEKGSICFGASMLRLGSCLPAVMPAFHARYPKVEMKLKDRMERELEALVRAGEVDLGIIVEVTDEKDLIVEPMLDDQVYVCVPDRLLREVYGEKDADRIRCRCAHGTDLRDLEKLPFCLLENRLGMEIQKCFDEAGYEPEVCMTSSFMQIAASVGFSGIAAFFTTQVAIGSRGNDIPADLNIFPLYQHGKPLYHRIYMIRRDKRYLPAFTRYFAELLKDHYREVARQHAERVAKRVR